MMRRRLLLDFVQGELPAEYQQVQYIEGTGIQWIETNYIPPAGVNAEWDYAVTGSCSGDKMIWGARDTTNDGKCFAERYANSWYCGNGYAKYSNVLAGSGIIANVKYHASMDSSALIIDNNSSSPTDTSYASPNREIYIFAYNNNGSVAWIHPVLRMYSLKFTYNNSVQADFVPCIRISDNKPGMYDLVGRNFYTNAGTGADFIIPS